VATPKVDYPKDKVVLFLPDAFGLELVNNQVRGRMLGTMTPAQLYTASCR
jgi:hypothetical protein